MESCDDRKKFGRIMEKETWKIRWRESERREEGCWTVVELGIGLEKNGGTKEI